MEACSLRDYVLSAHSEATLGKWGRALRHIRFCRAFGGHANDGDTFQCSILFRGEAGLLEVCEKLGLSLVRPAAGKPRNPIRHFPQFEEPGHTELFGVPTYVWIWEEALNIDLSGSGSDPYEIGAADFRNAQKLDAELARLTLKFRDPPVDSLHCICPKYWPELFQSEGP